MILLRLLRFVTSTWLIALAGALPAADPIEVHVRPDGDDAAAGSQTQPVASLIGARDAVRRLRAGGRSGPVRVVIGDGTYHFTSPLVLTPEDGGSADAPVSYVAAPGAKPVFSGGQVITGFTVAADGTWTAKIPDVATGRWYFEQLFVADRRAVRAREPNQGCHQIRKVVETTLTPGTDKRAKTARQDLTLDPTDTDVLRGLSPNELNDVNLVVYHNWDNTRRFLDAFDPATQVLTTSGEGLKPWNPWKKDTRYILENCRTACDAPGEWFLGRDGTLIYRPLPGQDPATTEIIAPVSERFVVIQGNAAKKRPVEHLTIAGLTFSHGQWLTPPGGFEPVQAAARIEAAIQVDGANRVTITDCEISHLGIYGIWFRKGCTNNTVQRCHLVDLGAGGVRIGEVGAEMDPAQPTSGNTVDNCIIHRSGAIFPCAVGVWIGASPDNAITHNEIADLLYTGISAGWRWGYQPSSAKRNQIRWNHVHHIGQGLLSDLGGVYTLGPSEGTVVAGNVFHDIDSASYGGWGMYTDEGSTGITFEDNLVYRTKDGSFHQHYGKDTVVRNNILVDSRERQVVITRAEPHQSLTFERNIIWWATGPALSGPWSKAKTTSGGNCWFKAGGTDKEFTGKTLTDWQKTGQEVGSLIADPLFTDPALDDFTVKPSSPALALGFKPFEPAKAGVYGDPAWIALARTTAQRLQVSVGAK